MTSRTVRRAIERAVVGVACACSPWSAGAQLHPISNGNKGPEVLYDIAFPNAIHHEAQVTVTWTGVPAGVLHLRMARGSAGRYALAEFAKNVYDVRASDIQGRALSITRPDPYGWDVATRGGSVVVEYTLFADRADGTYSGFDAVQAHIQPPGTFMYVPGLEERPVRVHIHRADPRWTIATQLRSTADSETFTGPSLAYLFDSPTHVGVIQWHQWTETDHGRSQIFRVAVDDTTSGAPIDTFATNLQRIVPEAAAVFGELPTFDYGTYTFVGCYRESCNADGMEHRNSTSITGHRSLAIIGSRNIEDVAHEFFHSWNVKRIRPKSLEPFDNERANMSGELWLAEGFTQYYGRLITLRAGLLGLQRFLREVGADVDELTNAPGRRYFGPIGMSDQAPFTDAAVSIDRQNQDNISISYYDYGDALAFALDLALRVRGKTLDDFMRVLWARNGKPEIPYTLADVRRALITASGDTAFATDFWRRYIEGRELPDYAPLALHAGLLLHRAHADTPWIGDVQFKTADGQVVVASATLVGSPLYQAGIDYGDHVLAIDGHGVATDSEAVAVITQHKPGDRMTVLVESRTGTHETAVDVGAKPSVEIVPLEQAGQTPTPDQLAFRQDWMRSHAK
jgi:predicted metalloprotease with PDZ domain